MRLDQHEPLYEDEFPSYHLFLLCIAHNTNFLCPVGTVRVKGSLDLEMQFHSFYLLVNDEILRKVSLAFQTLQW